MSDVEVTDWIVGCSLTVQTQTEEIQGEVFAYDKGSNTVCIRQHGSTPFHSNLLLLKISYIKVIHSSTTLDVCNRPTGCVRIHMIVIPSCMRCWCIANS